jgi:cytochrome c oxidase assembly protein subunit 11
MASKKPPHQNTIIVCTVAAVVMFALCFSMIPLYNALCRSTGLNGSVDLSIVASINNQQPTETNRTVTMQFVTTNNAELPWDFYPQQHSLDIHPEANNKMLFVVKNNTKHTMTVQAIPSITPWQAAKHLHKIECFCFRQQTLKAGDTMTMPVVFRIDKDIPKEIKTVTLAYTLFDVTQQKISAEKIKRSAT